MDPLQKLSENLTLDQVASLTDAEIVRRRYDSANARWMGALSAIAFFVAISEFFHALFSKTASAQMLPLAIAHVLFAFIAAAFFGELAYWERRRRAWKSRLPIHLIARNLTPWVMTFYVVEFTFVTFLREARSAEWIAWGIIFPWLVIPIRLETSRRLALHISLIVLVVLNVLILGTGKSKIAPEYTAVVIMNGLSFFFGAMISRRIRRQTIEEWGERRVGAREQLRMRDELQYAREVQLAMLPEGAPSVEWVDLAGSSLPATEVGGDYYDYFVDDDAVAIVSADVVAHTSRRRMLATAAVVRLDRASRRATLASAGHPPILVRRSGMIESIELFAPPLGVRLPYRVPSREFAFSSGDVFVLHSDGVYESQNAAGEIYGLDRLAHVLSTLDHAGAAEIRDAILRDIDTFRAGTPQNDDVTVVVARVL
jgi:hypothetical protein